MGSWNVAGTGDGELELLNGSQTLVCCSPKSKPDIPWLLGRMEELGVPPAYTRGLDMILFTRLDRPGDYALGRIRLSVDKRSWSDVERTFVHELCHHVDDMEDVTSDEALHRELKKEKKAKQLPDGYGRKNVHEYLAVGFEVYYVDGPKARRWMKKKNPVLYRAIQRLHRKYVGLR